MVSALSHDICAGRWKGRHTVRFETKLGLFEESIVGKAVRDTSCLWDGEFLCDGVEKVLYPN